MAVVVLMAVVWVSLVAVSAASLSVDSDALFAQITDDRPTTATTIVSDDFPTNGQLDGSVPVVAPAGSSWLVAAGQFTAQSSQAESKGNTPSRATIDLLVSNNYTASTQISALGSATAAGISFLGTGGTYMYAVYDSTAGVARIYSSTNGTPLASSAPLGALSNFTLDVQVNQPTVTVRINGAVVITYALAATQTGTRAGIFANARGTTFEFFTVVSP